MKKIHAHNMYKDKYSNKISSLIMWLYYYLTFLVKLDKHDNLAKLSIYEIYFRTKPEWITKNYQSI